MLRQTANLHPSTWWPIRRITDFFRSRWTLIEVTERNAKWANKLDGFAILNNYEDEAGYRLFVAGSFNNDTATAGVSGIERLPSALAAIYAYTETDSIPEVNDNALQVEIPEPSLGTVGDERLNNIEFDLCEITTAEHLTEIFPENESEIERVMNAMGDSGSSGSRDGNGGNGGNGGRNDDVGGRTDSPRTDTARSYSG